MLKYCVYQGCNNKYLPCSKLTFFSLPKDYRRHIWIENSGNPLLKNISPNSVRQFCEQHFDPSFLRRQFNRTILHRNAIPYKYGAEKLTETNSQECLEIQLENEGSVYLSSDDNDESLDIEAPSTTCNLEDKENASNGSDAEVIEAYRVMYELPESEQIDADDSLHQSLEQSYIADYAEDEQESDNEDTKVPSLNIKEVQLAYDKRVISSSSTADKEVPSNKRSSSSVTSDDEKSFNDRRKITSSTKAEAQNKRLKIEFEDEKDGYGADQAGGSSEYEEDKHFALSLVGYFQRLPLRKRSIAKLKILQYLTELQYSESLDINL